MALLKRAHVIINTTIMADNLHEIEDLVKLAKENKVFGSV